MAPRSVFSELLGEIRNSIRVFMEFYAIAVGSRDLFCLVVLG